MLPTLLKPMRTMTTAAAATYTDYLCLGSVAACGVLGACMKTIERLANDSFEQADFGVAELTPSRRIVESLFRCSKTALFTGLPSKYSIRRASVESHCLVLKNAFRWAFSQRGGFVPTSAQRLFQTLQLTYYKGVGSP